MSSSMLGRLLQAVISFVCGGSQESKPQTAAPQAQEQYQHHYPPSQQQWQRPPVESKPHHISSVSPHKPPQAVQQHQHQTAHYHKDQDLVNQDDLHYVSLRSQANEQGDAMAKCFEGSHEAYSRGDGARAKELSNEGKQHQKRMEESNRQASEWIFTENNKVRSNKPHEVDLHGLYVKEAISYTDRALQQARVRGDKEIHLIVGKGLHSKNGAAKLKPAIEELMHKYQLSAELDPNNSGVLVVQLDSRSSRGVGADEITRRLERSDGGCIIM